MALRYVVLVLEPLPADLSGAAARLSQRFDLEAERAQRLLSRAPGPLTRPVPERDARNVAAVLRSAGLRVEVREGSADGPVMEWILPDLDGDAPVPPVPPTAEERDPALTLAGTEERREGPRDRRAETGGGTPDPGPDPRKTYVPGMTVTTPPRDPMRTTLERDPPQLERSGLRRRIATAATLPAFLTLLVTLVALVVTLLPILRNAEARRAASTAHAVAATLEGLSGGLPLTAPLLRAQVTQVAERTAARLPSEGVDFLLVLDSEGQPLVAWYRGQVGMENLPGELVAELEQRLTENGGVQGAATGIGEALRTTGNDLLALAGLADAPLTVATAQVRRSGADAGVVMAGSEGRIQRGDVGWALLTTLLVGLIPVLFGALAALSLSRGVRQAILYLLRATDRISHGDFEREVELRRDDELGQIARAVERMRVSLREAMERLRRK